MSHKAYAFDWAAFDAELHPLLAAALTANDPHALEAFVDAHRSVLTDPYEGDPLGPDWRELLENRDVHEFGDFALTRYYDPADDYGVGYAWAALSDRLRPDAARALLGSPVGPPNQHFDPGRYGSYFQTPTGVRESLATLEPLAEPELAAFVDLLRLCVRDGRGLYVTF